MRLLLDSYVWGPAAAELQSQGHDVIWAGDWERDHGDRDILQRAHTEQRILLSLDKDFGELAIIQNQPHSGIMRLVGFSPRKWASVCQEVLDLNSDELQDGALVTAVPSRVRVSGRGNRSLTAGAGWRRQRDRNRQQSPGLTPSVLSHTVRPPRRRTPPAPSLLRPRNTGAMEARARRRLRNARSSFPHLRG